MKISWYPNATGSPDEWRATVNITKAVWFGMTAYISIGGKWRWAVGIGAVTIGAGEASYRREAMCDAEEFLRVELKRTRDSLCAVDLEGDDDAVAPTGNRRVLVEDGVA